MEGAENVERHNMQKYTGNHLDNFKIGLNIVRNNGHFLFKIQKVSISLLYPFTISLAWVLLLTRVITIAHLALYVFALFIMIILKFPLLHSLFEMT